MQSFLVTSVVASVVLTLALNLLPRLFPKTTRRAEQRVVDAIHEREVTEDRREDGPQGQAPRIKVFFPWKAMLAVSVGLTVLVNVVSLLTN